MTAPGWTFGDVDTLVLDDPDAPSPIDSDAPARLHGMPDRLVRRRGRR